MTVAILVACFIGCLFGLFLTYVLWDLEDLCREQQRLDVLDELWRDEEAA